jgi:type I restriction enzyme S subunit
MSAGWQTLTIGQLGRVVTGKTPKTSDPNNFGGQIPFVTPTDMDGCKVMATTARYLSELGASTVKSSIIPAGSVMVSCIGSDMGKSVIAKHRCVTNQQINSVLVDANFSSEFVYYNLSMRKAELQHLASGGSTMPILNKGMFSEIKIDLPPMPEQLQIAKTLSALDDRITLLRETNATLEAIAQALFKSWFVDFDPVRAKLEGRAPVGMDEAAARLFPDSFEESVLGLVPRGWRVATLADAFEINPTRKLSKGSMASYLDMASLATMGHCVEAPIEREMGSGAKFQNGDTLLARITPCLENGKSAFVDFLAEGQIGWGSTEFLVLRPKSPLPHYLGYLLCRHPAFREYAIQSMSGTSGRQRIQNDVLGRYLLAVPDLEIAAVFSGVIEPIQRSIAANHQSAQTLATLRDTLLPRLISGQLRLPEAQTCLEETAA